MLGKADKASLPDKLFGDVKALLRSEMEFFNDNRKERNNPEQKNRYEHVLRGFVASASHFTQDDIELLRPAPELAKALGEKDWKLPKELETNLKSRLFGELSLNAVDALACLANVGKIFTPDDVSTVMRLLPHDKPEATEMASMKFLLGMIGDTRVSQPAKDQALKEIETREWKSPQLDTELRKGLSDYVHGRVGDLKQLDRVIALVGNIGIEPPMALVVSRLGLPLDEHTIWDVEQGLRNFGGDRAAYSKVIENALILNAMPKELNLFGGVDVKALIQRMADGPITDNSEFAVLLGDKVPKLLQTLEDFQYKLLEEESAASGHPINRFALHDAIFEPWKRDGTISGGFQGGQLRQSVENLQQVTRDGHQTSYWWLAAGGVGYLARRFGPDGNEDKFAEKQKGALDQWKGAQTAAATSTLKTSALVSGLMQLDTAKKVGEYAHLLTTGSIIRSDELALTIAGRMGSPTLKTSAPFIYDGLRGTKISDVTGLPTKPGEIWERLRRNHATDLKAAPIFGTEFLGASDALAFLQRPDLKQPDLKTSDRYHFLSGKAHELALNESFKAIDSSPEYLKSMESYGKLIGVNQNMEMLFNMGMGGYKGEDFVKLARQLSKDMDGALRDLGKHQGEIKHLIEQFKDASTKASDADAKRGLDARVKQLEEMLKMIPGTNGGKNDERYDTTRAMCDLINSPDFNSDSFLKWMKDNGPILIWSTIAVAGVLAIPFSGGSSGVLAAIAVAAIVATVSYGAIEAYKEGVYQLGGSQNGSDFWRGVLELATGDKYIQQNLRYDPHTGKFKAPPTMNEAFEAALIQIGKDTALNLIGAGFGKLLSVAAKGLLNPVSKLAARELAVDAKVMVEGLEKVAAKNLAASTYGGRFTKMFFETLPLGVVGATADTIIQDELKGIKDNRELVEFAGHAASICLTVLFHRVGSHLMQPKLTRNGAVEIPYDKTAFIDAMKNEYAKSGKPMPKMAIEGDTVKFEVGGKVMELRFVDPVKLAASLDAQGVKPRPLLPGEEQKPGTDQKPPVSEEQKPGTADNNSPAIKPGTTNGVKPTPALEKPGTKAGAKLNTDTVGKPATDGTTTPKIDSKTFNANLETARQEYLKNPSDPVATAKLTDLLQQSVNEKFRVHGIPVEFAPKVTIEPLKVGELPYSEFSNETFRIRIGKGRLETTDGTVYDPTHEGFHAVLCLNRTAAHMHSRPAYMARLTETWAADLKAGHDIAGEHGVSRPADLGARNTAVDILEPVLKPYSKGVVTDSDARTSLDHTLATADGSKQLKILADKMGVTPAQAKEYLHKEMSNFFRLEKWHIIPESFMRANPKLKAYLESIGEKQAGQLGRLVDPLVTTHRGLFNPDTYKFSSPEEHRARIHQYTEELKQLLETRGKGAKTSDDAQNLIATIQEQSRLWQLQEQLRKLESAKTTDSINGHLNEIQKLAESIKKDLLPEDPLHEYLSVFDNCAPMSGKPSAKAPAATPTSGVNDGKAPTKKSGLEKPASKDGVPVKPETEKPAPDVKPVIDLFQALLADAKKTNYNDLLGKVRECKFTPDEIDGLTKLARRDGPELIERILKLPAEARSARLNELIRTAGSAENLRLPLATAEVNYGISKMDASYHKAMAELASTPDGLDLARRILTLPEDFVRQNITPESLSQKDVLATINKAETKWVEHLELERRGGKSPLKESDVLNPDQLARYKEIKAQQDALGKKPVELTEPEINALVEAYMKGEGHAKESLPPDGVVKKGKTLHIVLGAPGAGKSKSIVDGLQKEYGARLIDSDLIKPDIPGYKGGLGTQIVHPVSDRIATTVRNQAYAAGENIVQPVIGRTFEGIHAMIRQARAQGYDVAIHLADIPPETSVKRVYDRGYARDPVEGNVQQVIPLSYPLEAVGHRPVIVFDHLVKTPGLVDAWTKYDTNNFPAKLVDKSSRQLPPIKTGSPESRPCPEFS
ncbi:MAG: zeta toxin family protein [Candidatus Melainabacteria bacterium]|nr:zeta toxin family protein [Candidatus Melainabacteria bacterium]